METSLHQQLKSLYAGEGGATEVRLGRFRIDAVRDGELIEVQHAGLASIRDKVRRLLETHSVRVVKPIVTRKVLVRLDGPGGKVTSQRQSPKRCGPIDLFHELLHFTRTFPHPRLTLEAPEVELQETRVPGHGRRRRWRRGDFVVEDQTLLSVGVSHVVRTADDLFGLLPARPQGEFDTATLAALIDQPRWIAQRICYVLRETGAARVTGKRGNANVYEAAAVKPPKRRNAA